MRKKNLNHKSLKIIIAHVKEIINDNYEQGRQDKCKAAIYRNKIFPLMGISERTFWRYMKKVDEDKKIEGDPNQLNLFE